MTESEYIRLLAMLPLGREELRVAVNSSLLRLNDVQWNAFSQIAAEHHATIRAFKRDTRTTDFYGDSCWN
jgi:hypothetical protein